MKKKKKKTGDLVLALIVVLVMFIAAMYISAQLTYKYAKTHLYTTEMDWYNVQDYNMKNCNKVFDALKNGGEGLNDIIIEDVDITPLMDYANWENAEFEDIRAFGGGNTSLEPDSKGRIEYGDMWCVTIDGDRYMMYIQSISSRYGRNNDGVSFIAVTHWSHYDNIDWEWDWDDDEHTVTLGTSFKAGEE